MDLSTSSVFDPGPAAGAAFLDQILVAPRHGLLAVADAGPPRPEGRAAVRLALEAVRGHVERNEDILDRFRQNPTAELRDRILQILEEGFTRAAQEVYAFQRRHKGLRVTLDVALVLASEAFVSHVGDGRVYLVRRGLVHQLTVDHGRGDDEGIENFDDEAARRKQATRALGPEPSVRVESMCMEVSAGDRFFVCIAGVHRAFKEQALHQHLVGEDLDGLGPALSGASTRRPLVAAAAQLGGGTRAQGGTGRSRLAILAPMPLFAHCSERELRAVAAATTPRRFPAGAVIFRQGDAGTELYLVISGKIRIERDGNPIVTLGPGSNFGEMAMLDEPNRSAGAVCAADCELLVISRESFFALLKGNPMLAVKILWNMLLRLSANLRRLTETMSQAGIPMIAPGAPGPDDQAPARVEPPSDVAVDELPPPRR